MKKGINEVSSIALNAYLTILWALLVQLSNKKAYFDNIKCKFQSFVQFVYKKMPFSNGLTYVLTIHN